MRQVNKSVGRGLASAIETGEQVTEKTKETFGSHTFLYECAYSACIDDPQNIGETKDRATEGAKSGAEKSKEVGIRDKYSAFCVASHGRRLLVLRRRRHPGYVHLPIPRAT